MFHFINYLFTLINNQNSMDKAHEKHGGMTERIQDLQYCRRIKEFLATFKIQKCSIDSNHNHQVCTFHHTQKDKRRSPYLNHTFSYYPNVPCDCDKKNCKNYHTSYERMFHPLIYKTQKCNNFYDCTLHLLCPFKHHEDEKHFNQGQHFRFDITRFKTQPCQRKDNHERKVCLYYHEKDVRRPNFEFYSHIPCHKPNCTCEKSHNKIEQLYHPSRYKSKFCQTFLQDVYTCQYRDFCSFAHTEDQITIQLIDAGNQDEKYIINTYKTIWCPFTKEHDRAKCNYAHNIQDYRRRPRDYKYLPDKCENWNFSNKIQSIEDAGCKAKMKCNKCHGWMEHRYHPLNYQKELKKAGKYLKRQQPIERKLYKPRDDSKNTKQNNIQKIANKQILSQKNEKYQVGAPFFKNEKEISEDSKRTKAKTGNVNSEKSCNQSEKEEVRGTIINNCSQLQSRGSALYLEDEIWSNYGSNELQQRLQKQQTRSKSQRNSDEYEHSYSRSIKDIFLGDKILLDKLTKNKINQISLIIMDDRKINDMHFFNKMEKEKLVCKLREYSLKKDISGLVYSKNFTVFFVKNEGAEILQKLREKKVREEKIFKLQSKAIQDFTFLSEEEKKLLPQLLKRYKQEVQFGSLMTEVQKFVEQPAADNDFNNDN